MINYLSKFIPQLSHQTARMNMLWCKDAAWTWGPKQQQSYDTVKKLVTHAPGLAYYDVNKDTIVSAEASSYGIGGYIYQLHGDIPEPVALCSRTLTNAECGYDHTDKECPAMEWVRERFSQYFTSLVKFKLITDHKPLLPLTNSKDITNAPARDF